VLVIILVKIAIDLAFQAWSLHLYRRWSGDRAGSSFGMALCASILEPFSFQLMRHGGAALGWLYFLLRRNEWGQQRREGLNS
jgi:hypothetical protein